MDQFRDFASVFSEEAEYVQPPEDKVFIVLNLKLHTSNPIIDRYVYPDLFSIQDETGAMIPSFGLGLEQFTFLMGGESFCAECGFELDDQGDMGALVVFTIDENKADQVHQLIFADLSIPFTISE